jgi:D-alanyl-D-alanine carboxypeptidase
MLNNVIAALLIVLSLLPGSALRTKFQDRLENALVPPSIQEETLGGQKFEITPVPEKSDTLATISSNASAALFIDSESNEILFEKNSNKRLPMASTTKLMTALLAIERTKSSEIVTVPALSILPLDTTMGVSTGDKLKVSELLHGLLIESGADAFCSHDE